MADQKHITQGMQQTQNAIEFINKSVLKPDVKPMKGTASPMIDQATGMMVQDLQSFLKGFEQVGLVALARLANNILTYGTYFGPKPSGDADVSANASNGASPLPNQQAEQVGSDVMKGLFSVVGEYGKMKAEISSLIHSKHPKNDAIENASQAKTTTTTASNETSTTNAPTQHEGTSNAADVQQSVKPSPAKETTTNKPTTTAEDQKAKTASDDEKSHTATSLTDPEKKPTADHNEDQKLVNSLKNIEDIFEPLIETTEQLTEGIGEVENEFEQAIEEEMNDHDAANDTDEDDDNLDKKTYWFPKKK